MLLVTCHTVIHKDVVFNLMESLKAGMLTVASTALVIVALV